MGEQARIRIDNLNICVVLLNLKMHDFVLVTCLVLLSRVINLFIIIICCVLNLQI